MYTIKEFNYYAKKYLEILSGKTGQPGECSEKVESDNRVPQDSCLFKIPIELLHEIFKRVDFDDLQTLELTCKQMRDAVDQYHFKCPRNYDRQRGRAVMYRWINNPANLMPGLTFVPIKDSCCSRCYDG